MPLYEYQCLSCGRTSEVIQRLSEPPLATCDRCGGDLKKLLSAPAFQFKGSGWYVTDYAGKGKDSKDKAKDSGAEESKSKDSSKSGSGDSGSGSSSEKAESSSGSKAEKTSSD